MVLQSTGIVVIGVGVIFMLIGGSLALSEYRKRRKLGGATEFLKALTEFVRAVADKKPSLVFMAFGVLLIFLGGVIAGAGGFKGC